LCEFLELELWSEYSNNCDALNSVLLSKSDHVFWSFKNVKEIRFLVADRAGNLSVEGLTVGSVRNPRKLKLYRFHDTSSCFYLCLLLILKEFCELNTSELFTKDKIFTMLSCDFTNHILLILYEKLYFSIISYNSLQWSLHNFVPVGRNKDWWKQAVYGMLVKL
jgi:hypothetical protein